MSREMADVVKRELGLEARAGEMLVRNIRTLDRNERRYYFEKVKPLENKIKEIISRTYSSAGKEGKEDIVRYTVESMLEKRGDPDLLDSFVMDVVGRLTIYNRLREKSERQGVRLSAFTSFGGLSMVLFAVVILTAIALYIKSLM